MIYKMTCDAFCLIYFGFIFNSKCFISTFTLYKYFAEPVTFLVCDLQIRLIPSYSSSSLPCIPYLEYSHIQGFDYNYSSCSGMLLKLLKIKYKMNVIKVHIHKYLSFYFPQHYSNTIRFFYLPTYAQENCFKNIKTYINVNKKL
jgi:hypothetical protein